MRSTLPSLNALKAFEAAARHGSFAHAARELHVSAAAVSQQVRGLEEALGRRLFIRHRNRVALTDAGQTIVPVLTSAFDAIEAIVKPARAPATQARLVISVLPSLGNRWLAPVLQDFLAATPQMKLDLRVEDDPVDFADHRIDVRLCYGAHLYPDLTVLPLILDEVVPFCSPDFAAGHGGLKRREALQDQDLIHTDWGPAFASLPSWSDWFTHAGLARRPDTSRGHRVSHSSLAVDLAVGGVGVALGQRLLAEAELRAGRLLVPFGPSLNLGRPYCVVYPAGKIRRAPVRDLIQWLLREARPHTDGQS